MPALKGQIQNPSGKGGFTKGKSGNPGGRPKGSITREHLINALVDGVADYTNCKDKQQAIVKFISEGLRLRQLTRRDVLDALIKLMPIASDPDNPVSLQALILKAVNDKRTEAA